VDQCAQNTLRVVANHFGLVRINNSYGCQNSYTLNYLLKNELGFQV